ncbi:NADP:D-xylose dehydrogenase [Plectosphaerella plurivora]|uniref:D-xylose 1-dehydrogenase (NADP(+), D-xylono-1,5-lactone-forming) n=1 Tax=Plectosphaerella plurivora TaxID=936078 RepID=A0A9P8VDF2_9PEZI|nr:NADP:D-xylose dehydrogenase [Plectosphaerella plurivora]
MAPFTLRWGILATGWIAETFSKDLLTNPASREVSDVEHKIVAVSSSRDAEKAKAFLTKINGAHDAKTYGSYAELVADPDVDIIYVATPHSHHFQNAMLAIQAGKNVLCEKALTVTAEQTRRLVQAAREKNVFFMEAVWTRYQPLSKKVRELVTGGEIGEVTRVIADLSFNNVTEEGKLSFPDSNRMVNIDLAGGALLDLGIYSLTWVFQILYHLQPEAEKEKPTVVASINKYHTGSDDSTVVVCRFPKHNTIGIATTSLRADSDPAGTERAPSIRIQGTKGEIAVAHPAFRPSEYRVIKKGSGSEVEVVECPIPKDAGRDGWGHGFFWEADEAARCIRDGKKESSGIPLEESITIMEVMDEALRQGGVEYPALISSHEFDPKSPLNTGNA